MNHTPAEHAEILRSYIEQGKRIGDFKKDYQLDDKYVSDRTTVWSQAQRLWGAPESNREGRAQMGKPLQGWQINNLHIQKLRLLNDFDRRVPQSV